MEPPLDFGAQVVGLRTPNDRQRILFRCRRLDSSQRFCWRQASCSHRWIQARNHSDDNGKCNRPDERVAWYDGAPMACLGIDGGRETTEHRSDRPAHQREQSGFGDELNTDLVASRPECAAKSDLTPPLEHRDDHHVRDPDSTDEQRYAT